MNGLNFSFEAPSASLGSPALHVLSPSCDDIPSVEWAFDQPWLATRETAFQPGYVRLLSQGTFLCAEALLLDGCISRVVYPFNYPAFTVCDAFEMFLYREGDEHYHELHVTPSNSLLQLRLPVDRKSAHSIVTQSLFESTTEILPDAWRVNARVSLDLLTDRPEGRWKLSFGRYDHSLGNATPIISSTSPHAVCDFHRLGEWQTADLPLLEKGKGENARSSESY